MLVPSSTLDAGPSPSCITKRLQGRCGAVLFRSKRTTTDAAFPDVCGVFLRGPVLSPVLVGRAGGARRTRTVTFTERSPFTRYRSEKHRQDTYPLQQRLWPVLRHNSVNTQGQLIQRYYTWTVSRREQEHGSFLCTLTRVARLFVRLRRWRVAQARSPEKRTGCSDHVTR